MTRKANPQVWTAYGDYATIVVGVFEIVIDTEDIHKVSGRRWFIKEGKYLCTQPRFGGRLIRLHELIMGKKTGFVIDHINGNRWDNRKKNLRYATKQQNNINARISKTNTSGHKGVSFNKKLQKWQAYINFNGRIHLGFFEDKDEAIEVRTKAEDKYFGKFKRK